jgi:hypothetical protein
MVIPSYIPSYRGSTTEFCSVENFLNYFTLHFCYRNPNSTEETYFYLHICPLNIIVILHFYFLCTYWLGKSVHYHKQYSWTCHLIFHMTRRRGRRHMQLLDNLKETRRYWKLKEEAQDRTLWRTQFGRGYWHVARQTNTWLMTMN